MVNNVSKELNQEFDLYKKNFLSEGELINQKISLLKSQISQMKSNKLLSGNKKINRKIQSLNERIYSANKMVKKTKKLRENLHNKIQSHYIVKTGCFSNITKIFSRTDESAWIRKKISKLEKATAASSELINELENIIKTSNLTIKNISLNNRIHKEKRLLKSQIKLLKNEFESAKKDNISKEKLRIISDMIDNLVFSKQRLKLLKHSKFFNEKELIDIEKEFQGIQNNSKKTVDEVRIEIKTVHFICLLIKLEHSKSKKNLTNFIGFIDELMKQQIYREIMIPNLFKNDEIRKLVISLLPKTSLEILEEDLIDPAKKKELLNRVIQDPRYWNQWEDLNPHSAVRGITAKGKLLINQVVQPVQEYLTTEWTFIQRVKQGQNLLSHAFDRNIISKSDYELLKMSETNLKKLKTFEQLLNKLGVTIDFNLESQSTQQRRVLSELLNLITNQKTMDEYFSAIQKESERYWDSADFIQKNHKKFDKLSKVTGARYTDFAILPIQRGPRHRLLIKEMIRRTEKDTNLTHEKGDFIAALVQIEKYYASKLDTINSKVEKR